MIFLYIRDRIAKEIINVCGQYLFTNGAKNLMMDMMSIQRIYEKVVFGLKHRVLPLCGLVVSSHPHVSEYISTLHT